jgi:hypothetical protein
VEVDRVAPDDTLENAGFIWIGMTLDPDGHEPGEPRIARQMVSLTVIPAEIRKRKLNEPIQHSFEFRGVSSERNRGEQDYHITADDRLGYITNAVVLDTDARRFEPAAKATDTATQLEDSQREGLHLVGVEFHHTGEYVKSRRQVPVGGPGAVQNDDLSECHAKSSHPAWLLTARRHGANRHK